MNKQSKTDKKNTKPRESKCAWIDQQLEKGGMTLDAIAKAAHKKFGGNAKSTMSTVRARPGHMRAKGLAPSWVQVEAAKK